MQLANTPPLQSTTPGLHPVSIHQTSPLVRGSKHPVTTYYSIYWPRKDERLSRPAWLVTYQNKVPPPGVEPVHVSHPSTNRARRKVTTLIRPTLLPLCHAVTAVYVRFSFPSGAPSTSQQFTLVFLFHQVHPPLLNSLRSFFFSIRCTLHFSTVYVRFSFPSGAPSTSEHFMFVILYLLTSGSNSRSGGRSLGVHWWMKEGWMRPDHPTETYLHRSRCHK